MDDDEQPDPFELGQLAWHYTDFAGLQGILAGTLWASSLAYMNDTQEVRHAARVALDLLEAKLPKTTRHSFEVGMEVLQQRLKAFFSAIGGRQSFVACFSTEKDDLSQWRAYGKGGPSFSIGFDAGKLRGIAEQFHFTFEQVIYDPQTTKEHLEVIVNARIEAIMSSGVSVANFLDPERLARIWGPGVFAEILQIAPKYKHPKFAAEKEWRLVRRQAVIQQQPSLEHQFRRSGSLVIPYIELPLRSTPDGPLPIAEIMIGPTPHPNELDYAISEMASRLNVSSLQVTNSEVPFRNW